MKKSNKVTLFNKNHILIEEYNNEKNDVSYVFVSSDSKNTDYHNPNKYSDIGYYKKEEVKERKESPLGFYYYVTKIIQVPTEKQNKILNTNKTAILYTRYSIYGPRYHYVIQYPHAYNNVHIGIETRPYDLTDKNGLEDHFINDLKNELDKLFAVVYNDKISLEKINPFQYGWYNKPKEEYKKISIGNIKCKIYEDIFGFKDGPKNQSNQEKILSHGFDEKISFRKRKEE